MPEKKPELIAKYKEWYGRPVPTFDVDDDENVSSLNMHDDEINNDHEIMSDDFVTASV